MDDFDDRNLCIVLASPRSGTTILGEVLGRHPQIAHWYEPYFVWENRFPKFDDDVRPAALATPKVTRYIRTEFARFRAKSNRPYILEKTPHNALKIPFVKVVFPNAKWIHLYRDGYDTAYSIFRQHQRRKSGGKPNFVRDTFHTLRRQRYLRNQVQYILFELRTRQRIETDDDLKACMEWAIENYTVSWESDRADEEE